ncbi:integrating conjugative element protein, PFL_4709 family [Burkholderia pseudomallei]|uniref:TIGR03757 family integrating conjugative element protein n=1 Tax=Burkholderia pseudomallei TaxID=28450 RepID=UPI0005E54762|nr:TIGR03757 family integrating conjugative element protein [Burkholderia pseudomallei]MCW0116346.1 TIGR03757 family integrating conjugative element protein [Burkholderia pseudomallei]CAK1326957.1 integrating conjugative element protein, PFL_4709 family [Burkholderia pseudomallei]CAK1338327.1 integrating conjugative element protein, PFL_4709 family [Burkholderia pseudomallei]
MFACHRPSIAAHCYFALLAALAVATLTSRVIAAEIWIVTDSTHPVRTVPGARVIELDAPARLESELSANLPPDPHEAAARVQQRLAAGHAALTQQLATAYQAVTDAWSLGVTHAPAVIVDQRYVVYGDPDAAHAMARIHSYREAHP